MFTEIEEVFNFIKKHINKEYIITGNPQREERWQYPMDALREIIINMIVHRDYMHYGDSSIKIFDNSIEFFNPGNLPDTITIEQLLQGNYISQTRNKKVASIFKEAGLIEKYGSGIKRIQQQFIAYGLQPPVFENFQHGFRVIVSANEIKVGDKVGDRLSINQEKILELIQKNPLVSSKKLSIEIGISQRKIEENIRKLKQMERITRVGSSRTGHWELMRK
jgi:ATP-dependent DNA helicase RecG